MDLVNIASAVTFVLLHIAGLTGAEEVTIAVRIDPAEVGINEYREQESVVVCEIRRSNSTSLSSSDVTWYKSIDGNKQSIGFGGLIVSPFSAGNRYQSKILHQDSYGIILGMRIHPVLEKDGGLIGCSYSGVSDEKLLTVLGRITEVFIDVKEQSRREVAYKIPGSILNFPSPSPELGIAVKCHVQATTENVSVIMKLDGQELPATSSAVITDPINGDPFQVRISLIHNQLQNFKPSGLYNGKRLECIASTPNYPNVEVRNHVILNIQDRPIVSCKSSVVVHPLADVRITCESLSNPTFISAVWTIKSDPAITLNGLGEQHEEYPIRVFYETNDSFKATFTLLMNCTNSLCNQEDITLDVVNWPGQGSATIRVGMPVTFRTEPKAEMTTVLSSAEIVSNESQGISSSGDDEIVIEYTEPAQTQSTTSLITKIQKPTTWSPRISGGSRTESPTSLVLILISDFILCTFIP